MIALQAVTTIYTTVMHSTRCIPLKAQWTPSITHKKCWSTQAFRTSLLVASVINISMDIVFSLVPLTFLRKIQQPLRDKITISILFGLGLVASVASIMKAIAILSFGKTSDPPAEGINIALWSLVEEQVGVIVACLPCLKSLLQRILIRFRAATGLAQTQSEYPEDAVGEGNKIHLVGHPRRTKPRTHIHQLQFIGCESAESQDYILPRVET